MNTENKIVIFHGTHGDVVLNADIKHDTVWATHQEIASLFGVDRSGVTRHINKILASGEVDETSNVQKMHIANADRPVAYYSLDMILAVGYRVNSAEAMDFRKWATAILKQHFVQGYTVNEKRLAQVRKLLQIVSRSDDTMIAGVADVLSRYADGLGLLDDYDHQRVGRPKAGDAGGWRLSYGEARAFVDRMKYAEAGRLFGNEKDDSFKAALGAIYQTVGGRDVYPSIQEKAANLLYLIVKNHAFSDGNKRIAAALFVYFLDRNGALFGQDRAPIIANNTLAAMTLMIALSKPGEKDVMCSLVAKMLESVK